jgi:hypothetical protein
MGSKEQESRNKSQEREREEFPDGEVNLLFDAYSKQDILNGHVKI